MKRIVVLVAAASIMLIGVNPAQGQQVPPPVVAAAVEQFAFSHWTVMQNGTRLAYFAAADRGGRLWSSGSVEPNLNANGYGVVGKGRCRTEGNSTSCWAKGRVYELAPGDFEFDPLLASARMFIDQPRDRHEVIWTGVGDPEYPDVSVGGDTDYAGGGAGMIRQASVEGTIFDRPMKPRTPLLSVLVQGVAFIGGASVEGQCLVMHDDGTVTFHYTFLSE